jgi:peptidoglycan/LPS O-acetylase OafA/YrhL
MVISRQRSRSASLDLLRAVAVMLVIGRHFHEPYQGWSAWFEPVLRAWHRGGWVGVDLFFVLSGFLVSSLLFREYRQRGAVSVGRFLVRRGLKIYPAFYFFMAVFAVQLVARRGAAALPRAPFVAELLFVQNYRAGIHGHTWSLAVEEHFYLLCALLAYLLARRGRGGGDPYRGFPAIFAGVAVFCLGARLVTASLVPRFDYRTHQFPTHLRIDGLMFGVCLSYLYHFRRQALERVVRGREPWMVALGLLLLAPPFIFAIETTPAIYTFGFTAAYLGAGLLVLAFVVRELPDVRPVRVMTFFGRYSYSIYLWHWSALVAVEHACQRLHRPPGSPLALAVYFAGSLVTGAALARIVEIPALRLRDRLFPSRVTTPLA